MKLIKDKYLLLSGLFTLGGAIILLYSYNYFRDLGFSFRLMAIALIGAIILLIGLVGIEKAKDSPIKVKSKKDINNKIVPLGALAGILFALFMGYTLIWIILIGLVFGVIFYLTFSSYYKNKLT